jgi:hypothetical protein
LSRYHIENQKPEFATQNLPTMDDEALDTFISFTGVSADMARRYLGMTDNNAQQAIQLFFDSPDLASGIDQPSQPTAPTIPHSSRPQPRVASLGREDSRGVVHLDSDDEEDIINVDDDDDDEHAASRAAALGRAADYEDDEAIARRMQEELYAGGDASEGFDGDGVRAPIGRTTETLVGGSGGDWPPVDMHAAVLEQMRARQARVPGINGSSQSMLLIFYC